MQNPTTEVRLLMPADASAYVAVRRAMLQDSPLAFSADPQTDPGCDENAMRTRLAQSGAAVVGAFQQRDLIGAVGLVREPKRKMSHRVLIWGVWVHPAARGQGVGESMMRLAISTARSWGGVRSIGLSASETQAAAIRLYGRLGFTVWGTEPEMMCYEGRYYNELHMRLPLEGPR